MLWYENDGGSYALFTEHAIRTKGEPGVVGRRIRALDVDRDGDIDIVDASQVGGVTWFENNGVGSFTEHAVDTTLIFELVEADVDGDLDLDLIATTDYGKSVLLYVNDGNGGFAKTQIGTTAGNTLGAAAFDADGDGDADVVIVESGVAALRWYVNDGSGGFAARTTDNSLYNIPRLVVADLDNDGDLDLAAACRTDPNAIAWYENAPPQPPTITTEPAANVLENQTAVVDIQATDPEGETENGGGLTYSITGGVDRALFSIDSGTGVLTFVLPPDFEFPTDDGGNNVYEVQVTVTDSSLLTGILDLIVAVTDVDEPYDFGDAPSPYPTTLAENGAVHQTTGPTLGAAADLELDGIHSANADSDDANGDTPDDEDGVTFPTAVRVGQLGATVTVNVQNIATTAKLDAWIDFNADGSWGGPMERIARGVVMSAGDNTVAFDVPSDAISGTTFARFRLSTAGGLGPAGVADDGEVEDYPVIIDTSTESSGAFGSQITISTAADFPGSVFAADMDGDGDTDVLSASELDDKIAWYENDGSQNFTTHTISNTADGARSVFAADMDGDGDLDVLSASSSDDRIAWYENGPSTGNQSPTITTDDSANAAENQTSVVDIAATDPDGETENGGGLTYALTGGADQAKFSINSGIGVLTFKSAPNYESPTDNVYNVQVTVTDAGGLTGALDLSVTVTDKDESGANQAPTITTGATISVSENQTAVLDVASTDDRDSEGSGLTYSLTGGAEQSAFSIDPASGVLTFNAAPDYESPTDSEGDNVYEVWVTVTDSGGLTDELELAVTLTNVNESPTITTAATVDAVENQTVVVDLESTDPDGETESGGGLTYSITGGADQSAFAINTATGALTFNSAPDYESPTDNGGNNVYNVQITVTDGGGLTGTLDLAVTVTDVAEGSPDPPDLTAPTSSVDDLQRVAASKTIEITVTGNDVDPGDGSEVSGIASYDIYVLVDDADFSLWKEDVAPAEFPLTYDAPECNHRYGFRSVAKDGAGNCIGSA